MKGYTISATAICSIPLPVNNEIDSNALHSMSEQNANQTSCILQAPNFLDLAQMCWNSPFLPETLDISHLDYSLYYPQCSCLRLRGD